ncbi:MAG: recombinase family protein [Lachnospiraceae bacterium]|nr:recombinase family protein [Lachnospiraceae bacterium]
MEKIGYCRVSSKDQNPDRQFEAMLRYGVEEENIYIDYLSGKDFNRPQYKKVLKRLHRGDVLVVKSIDRLGRNYEEIIEQWRLICKKKHADIEVIEFPLLNTNQTRDGLTGVFISDITLQIMAYLAQTEREFIRRRQAEGIAIAKAKGVRFGAEKKEIPESFEENYLLWKNGKISTREAARRSGMSHSTFYRRSKDFENPCEKCIK